MKIALESFTRVCLFAGRCVTLMQVGGTTTNYVPVWQTWSLLRQRPTPSAPSSSVSSDATTMLVTRTKDLRECMQIARIKNRLTVHELAQMVRCDVETLAAFERGEGLVADDVERRIVAELRLT